MPQNKHALIRYRLIDERIRNKQMPAPSLNDLVELCSERLGKKVSSSTVQKDLDAMRTDEALGYRAPIDYNRFKRGYVYTDEDYSIEKNPLTDEETFSIELAVQILQQYKELPAFKHLEKPLQKMMTSLSINDEEQSIIQLDKPTKYAGEQWLQVILEAIKSKKVLEIVYQSFQNNYSTKHILEPILLKEFQQRWYLIANAISKQPNMVLTFGVDRIVEVKKTSKTFTSKFDSKAYFKNVFGITALDESVEKVQLQFTSEEAPYIKSAPWHNSQKVLKETKNNLTVALDLLVNHELKMKILSYGSGVKVLKPKHLKENIQAEVERMKKLYQ